MKPKLSDYVPRACVLIAFLAGLACTGVTFAHHSTAAFDMRSEVLIEGVLSEFEWKNPHSFLTVDVTAPDGTRSSRLIEASPGSVLRPMGVDASSLAIGERVAVRARPSRRGSGRMVLGFELIKSDGTVLPLHLSGRRDSAPAAAVAADSIAGHWLGRSEDMFSLRDSVPTWPLTDAGRAALAAVGERRETTWSDCIAPGPPSSIVQAVVTVIEVRGGVVTIDTDLLGVEARRVVRLGVEHPDTLEPNWLGHSIGRWESATLVVDTIGFNAQKEGFGYGLPSSAEKHIVERFSLSDDGRRLVYQVTAEDPLYLAAPVVFIAELDHRPELQPTDSTCDLEAAQRYLSEE